MLFKGKGSSKHSPQEGANETLGFVLLVAIAIAVSVAVLAAAGGGPLEALQEKSDDEQVQNAFSQVSSNSINSAVGGINTANQVDLTFANEGDPVVVDETSSIEVWAEADDGSTTTIVDEQIGHMEYDATQDYSFYYQNGGVWRIYDNNSVDMITSPEFHYKSRTLTLPLIQLSTEKGEYRDSIQFQHSTESRTSSQMSIDEEIVFIEVNGPTYLGWGNYFEKYVTSETVTYDHSNETVTMELGLGGELLDEFGDVAVTSGDISTQGGAEINGDVRTTGDVDEDSINGDVEEMDSFNLLNLDSLIDAEVQNAKETGTHKDGSNLEGETLTAGTYYVENLNVDGGVLTVDLSGGDVDLGVDGNVTVQGTGSAIRVENPSGGTLNVWMKGDLTMKNGKPEWTIQNEATDSNIVYGTSESQLSISQQSVFEGVLYAPSDDGGSSSGGGQGGGGSCNNSTATFCMGENSTVDGAVITGSAELKANSTLNYDSDSLSEFTNTYNEYALSRPELAYIHTSVTTVEVEDGSDS